MPSDANLAYSSAFLGGVLHTINIADPITREMYKSWPFVANSLRKMHARSSVRKGEASLAAAVVVKGQYMTDV